MLFITVSRENTGTTRIHYNDHGFGSAAMLIHGHPLSGQSWEKQAALQGARPPGDHLRPAGFSASSIGNLPRSLSTFPGPGAAEVTGPRVRAQDGAVGSLEAPQGRKDPLHAHD